MAAVVMAKKLISTGDLFRVAYEEMGGKADIEPSDLFGRADHLYTMWRDELIESWTQAIYQKHGVKLAGLVDKLMDRLEQVDHYFYRDAASSEMWGDPEDIAFLMANVTAVLRWHHTVRAGRLDDGFSGTVQDAEQWLERFGFAPLAKNSGQLSLFLERT